MARHLSHDEFFGKLADLFEQRRSKGHGSIFLVQKRRMRMSPGQESRITLTPASIVSYGQDVPAPTDTDPFPDLNPTKPLPVLVRASNGKSKKHRDAKIKLSTVVEVDALDAFYTRYADLCKSGMAALKPRDRSKKKAKARKKKGGAPTATAS
ncbi:hypothetical protein GCG54_00004507 [Colletotrichum gloeosporioides]|uniref:Signal recognition particle subunit SRP14 n=1 Tax=Colletotrichum gloeosporioides TaxID=474922 RepID=A0A8H4C649_COLGL|nr:uncharacterized protein GCG54_00004507 [Colletotrichum gloeosporioides]KAF3797877.1 hypothetical protein GCG54_00004507 [Colletotrichum gloeosporioides]